MDINIFLDSGAFSAWSKGTFIKIEEYIEFIKENQKLLSIYANLDVIDDPEKTWQNQKTMEKAGLSPLPTFHYGNDETYLKRYLAGYDYIALGGMVPIHNNDLVLWLDRIFSRYICNADGFPQVKVHGFGLTALKLLRRYPWYSVDSTSWVVGSRLGTILVPATRNGEYCYDIDPWKISVSEKASGKDVEGKHYNTLPKQQQKTILDFLQFVGITLEEVQTDYKKRDQVNIMYYLELEKSFPEWPWAFKRQVNKGFGI
jgi:hypothetical protein